MKQEGDGRFELQPMLRAAVPEVAAFLQGGTAVRPKGRAGKEGNFAHPFCWMRLGLGIRGATGISSKRSFACRSPRRMPFPFDGNPGLIIVKLVTVCFSAN
jgi:hypothetical protein